MKKTQSKTKKQCINLDALAISVRGTMINHKKQSIYKGKKSFPGGVTLDFKGYSPGVYQNQADIYYKGDIFATIQTDPVDLGNLLPDYCLIKVKNRLLYTTDWAASLIKICKSLGLILNHVNQIDIAVDQIEQKQGSSFAWVKKLHNNTIKMRGKCDVSIKLEQRDEFKGLDQSGKGIIQPTTRAVYARFGSRSSDKYARMYYKRQELNKSGKNYIESYWKRNQMNPEQDQEVFRFEIVLKRAELKTYSDVFNEHGNILFLEDLLKLQKSNYLAVLFNTAKHKFLDFCKTSEYMEKGRRFNRCKKLDFIKLRDFKTYLLSKIKTTASTIKWSAKVTVKHLYMYYIKTKSSFFMAQINEILLNCGLSDWFNDDLIDRWTREFNLKFKQQLQNYHLPYNIGATMKLAHDVWNIKYDQGGEITYKV